MGPRKPENLASGRVRHAPLEHIPEQKPKIPSSTTERLFLFGQNVYKQLTCTWSRKIIVGAFPFVAYFSLTFYDYRRTRYNFQLQQADFFKQSIACIANSPEVKESYGKDIRLKRASFWTVTSGFVPWIRERHVWLGFSGDCRDGWIRMGLRRTDFVLDKEAVRLISADIDNQLKGDVRNMLQEVKDESETISNDQVSVIPELETIPSEETREIISELESVELTEKSVELTEKSVELAENSAELAEKSVELTENSAELAEKSVESTEKSQTGEPTAIDKTMTAKQILELQILDKEKKDKLTTEENRKYMEKIRRLYPTLPENFGQNDVEQAIAVKKDREIDGQIFGKTWDLLSLSIHPAENDASVYVLYDPQNSYVDQADYWIDTALISIKKPESLRTSTVERTAVTN